MNPYFDIYAKEVHELSKVLRTLRDGKAPQYGWGQTVTLTTLSGKSGSVQAIFPEIDVYTVQFSILPKATPKNPILCTATLLWSVAGNHVQRQVTAGNGTSISATAEGVKVILTDATQGGYGGGPNQIIDYDVSVTISRGVRPGQYPPVLILPSPTPNAAWLVTSAAGFVEVAVPANTGAASVAVQAASATGAESLPDGAMLVAQKVNGNIFKLYDPRSFGAGLFVPIVPNCDSIRLINQTGTLGGAQTLAFAVTLGIDG